MSRFFRLSFGVFMLLSLVVAIPLVKAAGDPCTETVSEPCEEGHPEKGNCIRLCNPLENDTTDLTVILGTIIRVALGLVGSLTLLMLVWGGFKWLTSAGNPERVKQGTQTMLWAAIGVFFVFSSYFILINFTDYLTGKK